MARRRSYRRSKKRSPQRRKKKMSKDTQILLQQASQDLMKGKDPRQVKIELEMASVDASPSERSKILKSAEQVLEDPYKFIKLVGMATTVASGVYGLGKGAIAVGKWLHKTAVRDETNFENELKQFNEAGGGQHILAFLRQSVVPRISRNKKFLDERFAKEISTRTKLARGLFAEYISRIRKKDEDRDEAERADIENIFVPMMQIPSVEKLFAQARKAEPIEIPAVGDEPVVEL